MRPLLLLATTMLLAGCAGGASRGAAPPIARPTEADHRAIAELREAAPAWIEAQIAALWEAWIAGGPVDGAAIGVPDAGLLSAERLASLRRVHAAEKEPRARRALGALERWLAGELLVRAAAEESARLAALEAGARFSFEGKQRAFRDLEPLIAAEPDAGRRAAIHEAALPVVESLTPVAEARRRSVEEAARALGWSSGLHAVAALRQSDPREIADLAEAVLDATDALHEGAFDEIAQAQLGLGVADLRRSDAPRLLYGLAVARRIGGDPLQALVATLQELAISVDAIRFEKREGLRPLALAVAPPEDVRLALPTSAREWAPIFREAGAALHAAHLRPRTFEEALLAGDAVTRAFAALLAGITTDVAWLRAHSQLTDAEATAHARAAGARALYDARRAAGRLLAAIAGADAASYREAMERAWGHPLTDADAAWHALDRDLWLAGVDLLRGWILAAMLEEHLIEAHGERWWSSPEAGEALRALWAKSTGATPGDLARLLGADDLDPRALARRLEARLAPAAPGRG